MPAQLTIIRAGNWGMIIPSDPSDIDGIVTSLLEATSPLSHTSIGMGLKDGECPRIEVYDMDRLVSSSRYREIMKGKAVTLIEVKCAHC